MTKVDDPNSPTNPPPDETPTTPDLEAIPAGSAQQAIGEAFAALAAAVHRAEALAMACGRALDATTAVDRP